MSVNVSYSDEMYQINFQDHLWYVLNLNQRLMITQVQVAVKMPDTEKILTCFCACQYCGTHVSIWADLTRILPGKEMLLANKYSQLLCRSMLHM